MYSTVCAWPRFDKRVDGPGAISYIFNTSPFRGIFLGGVVGGARVRVRVLAMLCAGVGMELPRGECSSIVYGLAQLGPNG